ncbi:MAG: hypothetical protein WA252_15005 [Candidatus Sulfotelmatobacter sp.]
MAVFEGVDSAAFAAFDCRSGFVWEKAASVANNDTTRSNGKWMIEPLSDLLRQNVMIPMIVPPPNLEPNLATAKSYGYPNFVLILFLQ